MTLSTQTRRGFLGATALSVAGLTTSGHVARANSAGSGDTFHFEVQRSEAEWRAALSEEDYHILREGGTEAPKSSPLWENQAAGTYHCKGCALPVYTSRWQAHPGIGFVFFRQNVPNSVLMGIDQTNPYTGSAEMVPDILALIETHCRRCGSHFGHLLTINGTSLHCINGASLDFAAAEA